MLTFGTILLQTQVSKSFVVIISTTDFDQKAVDVTVHPKNKSYARCPQLSHAFFTIHIHYSTERFILNDPIHEEGTGIYTFNLRQPLIQQLDDDNLFTVEVLLNMGYFPGGIEGMPCAEDYCIYEELIDQGMDWNGERIGNEEQWQQRYTSTRADRSLISLDEEMPVCQDLSDLPGSYISESNRFQPYNPQTLKPCQLIKSKPLTPANSNTSKLRWLRFIGDSNMRYAMPAFAKSLSLKECLSHTGKDDKHPTTWICWSDSIIFTFNWWYQSQFEKEEVSDPDRLRDTLEDYTLKDFLESVEWDKEGDWPESFVGYEGEPERIYLLVGSHAPASTALGVKNLLTSITPLITKIHSPPTTEIVLLLTSSIEPSLLPAKYQPTKVMRNNVMLRATNKAIKDWAKGELGLKVLDLMSMTRMLGREWSKDAVHFRPEVYDWWADSFYTDWIGEE